MEKIKTIFLFRFIFLFFLKQYKVKIRLIFYHLFSFSFILFISKQAVRRLETEPSNDVPESSKSWQLQAASPHGHHGRKHAFCLQLYFYAPILRLPEKRIN